jgi:hypothetical protein
MAFRSPIQGPRNCGQRCDRPPEHIGLYVKDKSWVLADPPVNFPRADFPKAFTNCYPQYALRIGTDATERERHPSHA